MYITCKCLQTRAQTQQAITVHVYVGEDQRHFLTDSYFSSSVHFALFAGEEEPSLSQDSDTPFNFITHCFFLTHKALMLGEPLSLTTNSTSH